MKFCWPRVLFLFMVVMLSISSLLVGCGKTGDLYLPDEDGSKKESIDKLKSQKKTEDLNKK